MENVQELTTITQPLEPDLPNLQEPTEFMLKRFSAAEGASNATACDCKPL